MIQLKSIVVFLGISLVCLSCSEDFFEKPIDININQLESKLAGTALLGVTSETNLVLVSFSQNPFEDRTNAQVLKNATVTLTGNNTTVDFHPEDQSNFYKANSTVNFIPNMAYTLNIAAPNYTTISATQIYPESVPILDASLNTNTFKIKINDNPNQKDYYLLRLMFQDDIGNFMDTYIEPFASLTDESSFCNDCVIFNDVSFNGELGFEIVVSNFNFYENTTYKAVLYHITEDFYRYDTTLRISDYAEDNPFVEPVILHHNFDNGYGIFALVNKSEFIFTP